MTRLQTIGCRTLIDTERADHPTDLFGSRFPLRLEPSIYFFADNLSAQYRVGYWELPPHLKTYWESQLRRDEARCG